MYSDITGKLVDTSIEPHGNRGDLVRYLKKRKIHKKQMEKGVFAQNLLRSTKCAIHKFANERHFKDTYLQFIMFMLCISADEGSRVSSQNTCCT